MSFFKNHVLIALYDKNRVFNVVHVTLGCNDVLDLESLGATENLLNATHS